jgi:hypothetical protein
LFLGDDVVAFSFQALRHIVSVTGVWFMAMTSADAATIQPGMWSGNGATLTTAPQQTRLDVGTGIALIKGGLHPDAKGNFKAIGMFEAFAPGPQRADVAPVMRKAHISGRTVGTSIELTMHVDGERAMRKFVLKQGRGAKLVRPL